MTDEQKLADQKEEDRFFTEQISIQKLQTRIKELDNENKEFREHYRWVPVSERLPEFNKHVLVWCRIYGRYIGSYNRLDPDYDWGNWHDGKELGVLPPLFWQELPEPPKI